MGSLACQRCALPTTPQVVRRTNASHCFQFGRPNIGSHEIADLFSKQVWQLRVAQDVQFSGARTAAEGLAGSIQRRSSELEGDPDREHRRGAIRSALRRLAHGPRSAIPWVIQTAGIGEGRMISSARCQSRSRAEDRHPLDDPDREHRRGANDQLSSMSGGRARSRAEDRHPLCDSRPRASARSE
jgi:hypothetical protein